MRTLKAGAVYFLLLFAVGWVLGPIRELWAVPRFGRLTALLFEAVIMLIAMTISARWVIRRFDMPQTLGATIPMGLIAIGLLVPTEIAGVLLVRGGSSTLMSHPSCNRQHSRIPVTRGARSSRCSASRSGARAILRAAPARQPARPLG